MKYLTLLISLISLQTTLSYEINSQMNSLRSLQENFQENSQTNTTETCTLLCTFGCKGGFGASCCSKEAFEDPHCVVCNYVPLGGNCKTCKKGYVYDGKKCLFKYSKKNCTKARKTFKGKCRCVKPDNEYYCI